jgi:hypothetical protein
MLGGDVYNPSVIMLANLRALFGCLFDIILLRRGPESLPASPVLLVIAVALNVVLYSIGYHLFLQPIMPAGSATSFVQILAGALLTLLWFRIAFQLASKSERFLQTMIAMFAAETMTIPALPLLAAVMQYTKPGDASAPILLLLLAAVVGIWILAVLVHIVKSAFEWSWVQAVLMVFGSNIGIGILLALVFGETSNSS